MKIMDIVKFRWPELLVLVMFHACCIFLVGDMQIDHSSAQEQSFSMPQFLMGIGLAAFSIIAQMLLWGFLRTTAVSGTQPIAPGYLLIAGRWYFWKLFVVQLLLFVLFFVLAVVFQLLLTTLFYGKGALENSPVWIQIISLLAAGALLLKPTYFIPAVVLVRDCTPLESLPAIRLLSLWEMKTFLPLVAVVFVLVGAMEYLSTLVLRGHLLYYPFLVVQAVVSSAGLVMVFLSAVLEVLGRIPKPSRQQTEGENDES